MKQSQPVIYSTTRSALTGVTVKIMASPGFWIVVHDHAAINIMTQKTLRGRSIYVKNGFANQKHAENLAEKLNRDFDCDLFRAIKVA
jgi:hypothetical protein